ncbi:NAD(P)H-hydrate dehydratase [bacterium]|nr:NAD(P)H-hydrate dehydratase [Rubripirellula sp.]MDA7874019.1 NAD(P)H-hydrate dehydratase [Rhodopirellula sp.]MDA7878407.1 NAD(P)H-hydrate dehydratase [bacterium]MDA7904854.1 NAD(P)H-hydrate dehydratase [Rhodopirellula sp.]MDA8968271.1 NAD(P)H-hydrate dehydratase [bacterium]MDB4477070.1 NAD(P)H-hydrate dehydratase [Rhodopirellula sp.]
MNCEPPLRLPTRQSAAHKGDFGRSMLVGGSRGMSGSIALSAIASLRVGAGLVTAVVPDRCLETVASFDPCIMTYPLPDDSQGRFALEASAVFSSVLPTAAAIGCGPGMTTCAGSIRMVERLLTWGRPCVLDADAINVLSLLEGMVWQERARARDHSAPLILTPHPGELARLTGVSARDRKTQISVASKLCDDHRLFMVVKGGPTVVVGPGGKHWQNSTGNPGMATAGSGDVLTGVLASFLSQGIAAWDAIRLGVWVHGLAGDLAAQQHGQAGMTAVEICGCLPQAVATTLG